MAVFSGVNQASDKLWLPVTYQQHFSRLFEVSQLVDGKDGCHQLLRGTISEGRSTPDRLIFKFRCRTETRETFLVHVNANTMEISSSLEEQRKNRQKVIDNEREERLRVKLANRSKYWEVCQQVFDEKTRLFSGFTLLTQIPPRPDFLPEGVFVYEINFKALSAKGRPIMYSAKAVTGTLDQCDVEIKAR